MDTRVEPVGKLKGNLKMVKEEIDIHLAKMNKKQSIIFALFCSKYLLDNYEFFSKLYSWGNISILQEGIQLIDIIIGSSNNDEQNNTIHLAKIISDVDKQIPDTNDFSSIICSFGLDAGNTILESLKFLLDGSKQRILDVSIFCIDTVDTYIQEIEDLNYNDPFFEMKILGNELMISELNRQE